MSNSISPLSNSITKPVKNNLLPEPQDAASTEVRGNFNLNVQDEIQNTFMQVAASHGAVHASSHPAIAGIMGKLESMTPKARILGDYIVQNPGKVVLMTTRELARTCGISEATVVRFAVSIGYNGYGELQQALKDFLSAGIALPDRAETNEIMEESGLNRLHRVIFEELSELRFFYETVNINVLNEFIRNIITSPEIYIIGSRISYSPAYYMGWSLTKIRKGIHILKGSDTTSVDTLTMAREESLVVIVATSPYPNELIKLSKLIQRLGLKLLVITDNPTSPVGQFASLTLNVPVQASSFTGNPSNMLCAVKYIVQEVAAVQDEDLRAHQKNVEQIYLENDILFNLRL